MADGVLIVLITPPLFWLFQPWSPVCWRLELENLEQGERGGAEKGQRSGASKKEVAGLSYPSFTSTLRSGSGIDVA